MNVLITEFNIYIVVFARMAGMILLNPLFSRRNVPSQVKMGLVLCLTILIAPTLNADPIKNYSELSIAIAMFFEVSIGFICGFVFQIFYYMLFLVGDLMDMQFGLSMSKVFDPGSNIQMSVSGNLISLLFMLFIFATDSHLLMIKIFASSYMIVPIGVSSISFNISSFMINLFINVFLISIKLLLPFIIAEFTVEISMGVLMKLVPQINVFTLNIPLKLLFGIILLLLFAYPMSAFIDNYIGFMFKSMEKALYAAAS